ncbi:ADR110Cp [Eremothecium gossypii ATCC 10895]|uniref:tRNA (guanine(9)-N1)-methyltransferase n=1 Tax=Eremothecium gossypii (strain ATCC 10895 / CBS 109.51 / FGSC 9923 / NRRL Y-1056) TaxID=284811 RepID=TRM10_EREGS|nr:ADR110Cp [Eremothecium gossypii ATCC 10895]Q75A17.1 RecName: Full=tRNA (guanine(9)-N1)-methyltransferase; AltName: Full=tRNA methyltransferase 10; AltName: Full=tRNA(m1G9)-methyltransferase; Short=tRNA(m1G9)MTase [Eremothecium gossypii ATCC 10895]AAS52030.1 ADR110Cp [Eremothecium gossypii ATCC 10895]AEY96329.1 FADR110Cp [Eremothecium gossypii FDAG1]
MTPETNNDETLSRPKPRAALPPVPEGMSKSQWKKQWKKEQFELNKPLYAKIRKEKKQKAREQRRERLQKALEENGGEIPEELRRTPRVNVNQKDSGIKVIIDCAFDELMNEKEIVSLSTQITRAYSANKRENHFADVKVTSFNKRLKERFDCGLKGANYDAWKHFEFTDESALPTTNAVYLTADTDETLETLEPGTTYIVGGIVDKNRHKALCYNKAKELGIPTRRLPIGEYIKLCGRKVLTTTHVIQIMLRYFDNHDWKEAFESVLPARKLAELADHAQESNSSSPAEEQDAQDI